MRTASSSMFRRIIAMSSWIGSGRSERVLHRCGRHQGWGQGCAQFVAEHGEESILGFAGGLGGLLGLLGLIPSLWRCSSSRLRAVMSSATPTTPMICPCGLCRGSTWH